MLALLTFSENKENARYRVIASDLWSPAFIKKGTSGNTPNIPSNLNICSSSHIHRIGS